MHQIYEEGTSWPSDQHSQEILWCCCWFQRKRIHQHSVNMGLHERPVTSGHANIYGTSTEAVLTSPLTNKQDAPFPHIPLKIWSDKPICQIWCLSPCCKGRTKTCSDCKWKLFMVCQSHWWNSPDSTQHAKLTQEIIKQVHQFLNYCTSQEPAVFVK